MFDFLVILVIVLSTAFAAMRGATREISTLIALAGAAFMGLLLVEPTVAALGKTGSFFTTVFAAVGIVGVFFIFFHVLAHLGISRIPFPPRAALVDRITGGVFGFARGLVLVGLGFLAYGYYQAEERQPESVKSAMTRPLAAGMANWFQSFTPEDAYIDNETLKPSVPEEDASILGYERTDRNGLEEVITTVTTTDGPAAQETGEEIVNDDDPMAEILAEEDPQ